MDFAGVIADGASLACDLMGQELTYTKPGHPAVAVVGVVATPDALGGPDAHGQVVTTAPTIRFAAAALEAALGRIPRAGDVVADAATEWTVTTATRLRGSWKLAVMAQIRTKTRKDS